MNETLSHFKLKSSPILIAGGLSLLFLLNQSTIANRVSAKVFSDEQARKLMLLAFQQRSALFKNSLLDITENSRFIKWPTDQQGEGLLHWATLGECSSCVDLLIGLGHPINTKGIKGRDPLSYAVEFGDMEIAEKLLKAGARVDFFKDQLGHSLIDLVDDGEIRNLLLKYK